MGTILLALLFALPFNVFYPVLNWLFLLVLLASAAAIVLGRRWPFTRTPLDLPLLAFVVWSGLSVIRATDPFYSLREWWNLVGTQVLLFYLAITFLDAPESARRTLSLNLVALAVICAYGIPEFFLTHGSLLERGVRARALTSDYNWLSSYLIMSLPLACGSLLLEERRAVRAGIWTVLAAAVFLMYLTYNRAGWLALVIELAVMGILLRQRAMTTAAMAAVAVMFAVFAALSAYNQTVPQEDLKIHAGTTAPTNLMDRLHLWRLGAEEIGRHPWVGIGYGRESLARLYGLGEPAKLHLHSTFLETALETGVPGLLALIWVFWVLLTRFLRGAREETDEFRRIFAISLFVLVSGTVVRNLFDHMFVSTLAQFFWCVTAVGLALMPSAMRRPSHAAWRLA